MKFAELKVRMWTLKSKDDNYNTFENLRKSWSYEHFIAKRLSAKVQAKVRKKVRKRWNFFYSNSSLFIGVRGGAVSRTRLDPTVARYPEDACPLWRSEGDIFTEFQKSSWNRIVEVNPLPRGASVGEFRKKLSPSKRWVWRDSWNEFSGWLNITKVWNLEPARLWSRESAKIWNLEPAKLWSRESAKIWNPEPAKPWSRNLESGSVKIGNLLKIKFRGYSAWRFLWIKDSWTVRSQVKDVASKVWVWRVN
jgi:hypothetical protein